MPALTQENDIIRARNVAASECYALLGKHPYSDPQKIYDRLSSPYYVGVQQTTAMRIGSYLEPHVARFAAREMGLRVRANGRTREHGVVNLCATPDYIILGQPMLMEIKVSSITYGWTEDDLHPHYEYQARAQMACTGRDLVFVVALVGSALHIVPVARDQAKEERLLDAVDTFWQNHVMRGVRPTIDPTPLAAVVTRS